MLSVRELSVSYATAGQVASLHVLDNISFNVAPGEHCTIVGPSGCGKTTLLLVLAGLLDPSLANGVVEMDGRAASTVRGDHKIGFVFQRPTFFEWLTIRKNVALPLRISGHLPADDCDERAHEFLTRFGLESYEAAYPHQLSGGMLSRVALARALVHEPKYLILDEAFNHLDEVMRYSINADLERTRLKIGATAVGVTHDLEEAVLTSDVVVVLSHKPARVTHSVRVPLPRPRTQQLRDAPVFREAVGELRDALLATYNRTPL